MNIVKGSTTSETILIKAIQATVGAVQDGAIGIQTMTDIAVELKADCFPLTVQIYGMPVIIAEDILPFSPKKALSNYTNSLNGSFYANGEPCSILISGGKIIRNYACHNGEGTGYPESVLYRLTSGAYGVKRVRNASLLPSGIKWAVGGLGLLDNYAPATEGFCKITTNGVTVDFSDVLRTTNHGMLGIKNGYCYLVYCKNMSSASVNALAKKLGLEMAIMLDGGHLAAINGAETFAKINTSTKQFYAIQGVNV